MADNGLLSQIRDKARHCDPPVDVELVSFKFEGHDLLMIEVFESAQKPHGFSEGYFLRAQSPSFFDKAPCPDFHYPADFSVPAFRRFLDAARQYRRATEEFRLVVEA